ncbi:MAG: vanadium-dependent haloperoxidase [Sphingobacteriales bacterium]|nr:vanadium-dependent haloperoxidase [Sphingobacteriales bacterium]
MKKLSFILIIISIGIGCNQKQKPAVINISSVQHDCVHRLTDVIVYDIFTPPVASRIYAYSNLAYYEALKYKTNAASITAQLKGFDKIPLPEKTKQYDFNLAAVKSFFKVARGLTFSKDSFNIIEKRMLDYFESTLTETVYQNSISLGDTIASVILKRSADDNYKKTRGMPKYSVFKEEGKWQQTPPDYADATEPHWLLIKPLLMDSAAQFKPAPPPAYSLDKNSVYYKELMEVFTVSKNITAQQDTIAHYWDDNPFVTEHKGHLMFATKKTTPGGHWMGIISILCKQTNTDEITTARTYALTAAAIFDGFISCWQEKYRSRMVRPITVIREKLEPTWTSFLQTPPFPEYTSGHSVITAAAATVLSKIFGDSVPFHDTTELEYLGLERNFSSIQAAADEAGISRLYGGIHYRSAIEQGKEQGKKVGQLFNAPFK